MVQPAACFVPEHPIGQIVELAQAAERLGFDRCWIYDEGLAAHDVYVTLTAIAQATERIERRPGLLRTRRWRQPHPRPSGIERTEAVARPCRPRPAGLPGRDRGVADHDAASPRGRVRHAAWRHALGSGFADRRHPGRRPRQLARYRTEIPGLYLSGAATYPGAGILGASGRNAAAAIIADARGTRSREALALR